MPHLLVIGILNVVSFILMAIDKWKAEHHSYRIPESYLYAFGICYASLGIILGMYIFHHKIRKKGFLYGMPFYLTLQVFIIWLLILK